MKKIYLVILLLLAAQLAPINVLSRTTISAALSGINEIESALFRFGTDVRRLPTTEEGLNALVKPTTDMAGWKGPYLKPSELIDPWAETYKYYYPALYGTERFDLYSMGINNADDAGKEDDISNWNGYSQNYYPKTSDIIVPVWMSSLTWVLALDFPLALVVWLIWFLVKRKKAAKRTHSIIASGGSE